LCSLQEFQSENSEIKLGIKIFSRKIEARGTESQGGGRRKKRKFARN
jgi:hypothetical protein